MTARVVITAPVDGASTVCLDGHHVGSIEQTGRHGGVWSARLETRGLIHAGSYQSACRTMVDHLTHGEEQYQ